MGVEPTSLAWKANVLAIVRHLQNGAGGGTRTHDNQITNLGRYQLRYASILSFIVFEAFTESVKYEN